MIRGCLTEAQIHQSYTHFLSSSWPVAQIYIVAASNGIVDTPRTQDYYSRRRPARVNKGRSKYARGLNRFQASNRVSLHNAQLAAGKITTEVFPHFNMSITHPRPGNSLLNSRIIQEKEREKLYSFLRDFNFCLPSALKCYSSREVTASSPRFTLRHENDGSIFREASQIIASLPDKWYLA